MKISMMKTRDVLTPEIRAKIAKAKAPKAALEAMGLAVVSMAQRAFTQPGLRISAWAPLKPATLKAKARAGFGSKTLISSGALAHSARISSLTARSVTVGSDRKAGQYSLAGIHQLGTKKIPARPFFPFDDRGRQSGRASRNIQAAAKAALDLER